MVTTNVAPAEPKVKKPDAWGRLPGDPDYGKNPNNKQATAPAVTGGINPTDPANLPGGTSLPKYSSGPDMDWYTDPKYRTEVTNAETGEIIAGGMDTDPTTEDASQGAMNPFTGELITPEAPVIGGGQAGGQGVGGVVETGGMTAQEQMTLTGATQQNVQLKAEIDALVAAGKIPATTDLDALFKGLSEVGTGTPYQGPVVPGMAEYLEEYKPEGFGTTTPAPVAEFDPTGAGKVGLDKVGYGEEVAYKPTAFGEKVEYKPGYSPEKEAELRKETEAGIKAGLAPTLKDQLAGSREEGARRGLSAGLQAEAERPIREAYIKEVATGMRDYEMARLSRQMTDIADEAKFNREQELVEQGWDRGEAKNQAEMEMSQKLEKGEFSREERLKARELKAQQDLTERDFIRNQTATALGQDYAQKLNQQEWDRDQKVTQQQQMIQNALTTGQMKREDAMTMWNAANQERMNNLNNSRADLQLQIQIAQQNNMFEKTKALTLEMGRIEKEIADRQSEAQEDAGMWGGIGSGLGIAATLIASDRRLKRDIKRIGTHKLGIGIYHFKYLWNDIEYTGVMANEVKTVMPEAVVRIGNYDAVNYDMLGGI